MGTAVTLEIFEPRHIAAARALWERSDGVGLSEADEPAALASFLIRNEGLSFVAVQHGRVIGTVLCGHDGRRGLIHHLVVCADHRRQGLARRLLQSGLAALHQAGIGKCHLLVFRSNADGLAFWRAVGAQERVSMALFSIST
jgi:N-acetylglutamate synthase